MAVNGLKLMEDYDKALTEIHRLKEILCCIREVGMVDFNDTVVKLARKGIPDDFYIPFSRFGNIVGSL